MRAKKPAFLRGLTLPSSVTPSEVSRRTALALTLGGVSAASSARGAGIVSSAALEALATQAVAEGVWPGASISVMKAGKPIYAKGFGSANLETMTPVTPGSVFKIGSITKQFTAATLVLLQEDGRLSLDDRLANYLPTFPRAADVTLRQMLTHTSGIGNYTDRKDRRDFFQSARIDYDAAALLKAMIDQTDPAFVFEPGASWGYSNTAFVLLGLVIEKVTGEPYGAVFRRRLFEPAMMKNSAVDDAAQVVVGRASGYSHSPSGAVVNASFIAMSYPGAAGSIRSTAGDLCLWHSALFGGKIVKPAGLSEMITPARLNNGALPMRPPSPDKAANSELEPIKYGFGLQIGAFEGRRMIGHNGGINGFVSALHTFPDQRTTVAILVNGDGAERPTFGPRFQALQDAGATFALMA